MKLDNTQYKENLLNHQKFKITSISKFQIFVGAGRGGGGGGGGGGEPEGEGEGSREGKGGCGAGRGGRGEERKERGGGGGGGGGGRPILFGPMGLKNFLSSVRPGLLTGQRA